MKKPLVMSDLVALAHRVVNEPWGVGDAILEANSESWAPYLRFLHAFVKEYQPDVALECGVYMGTATRHMALGSPDTLVMGIDRDFHLDVLRNVPNELMNARLIRGDTVSDDTISDFLSIKRMAVWDHNSLICGTRIDLLFLDSTHDGDTPTRELMTWAHFMEGECLVVCDDLLGPARLKPKMQEFWAWLPGEKQELHFLHPKQGDIDEPGFGISILRRDDIKKVLQQ